MFSTPIHVIDFEGSRQSGVVEHGVVTLKGSRIDEVRTRICAPLGTISDLDRRQHGISEELAAGADPFNADWDLFANLRGSGPLCAHSAAVEDGFLRSVWPYPCEVPDFLDAPNRVTSWGPWVDTLALYRRIYPQLESYKLSDLIGVFDLQRALKTKAEIHCPTGRQRYHCALYDALASALLLLRLYELPEFKELSLRWLILQSASSEAARESMGQQRLF